jgi:probable rRNA maturation factor
VTNVVGQRTSRRAPLVEITSLGGPHAGVSSRVLKSRAEKMLRELGLKKVELSLAIVDDETIRELNKKHRKKNKPTDVLSFPLLELRPGDAAEGALGDVILSVPTARRQAAKRRRPLLDELTMLLAHGILHLLGFDHRNDAEDRVMTARTRELERAATTRSRGGSLSDPRSRPKTKPARK